MFQYGDNYTKQDHPSTDTADTSKPFFHRTGNREVSTCLVPFRATQALPAYEDSYKQSGKYLDTPNPEAIPCIFEKDTANAKYKRWSGVITKVQQSPGIPSGHGTVFPCLMDRSGAGGITTK